MTLPCEGPEAEISEDLRQSRRSIETRDLRERLKRGEMPIAQPLDPLAPGEICHFACPVRFGRRRSDYTGHLVLTMFWLKFRGVLDTAIAWSEVSAVRREGADILVRARDGGRTLRFCCQSVGDAARGYVIADHLSKVAAGVVRPEASAPQPSTPEANEMGAGEARSARARS